MTSTRTVPDPPTPAASILETAAGWPGVTTRITPRGATAIVVADKELGHVHLDRATLDMPVGMTRRSRIVGEGRAKEWFSDWISKPLMSDADVTDGLLLLRESYDEQHTAPQDLHHRTSTI